MAEEVITGEHSEKTKRNKKLIPSDVSAVGYITKDGFVRTCKIGIGIPLPDDFKEWHNQKLNPH
jgi:hypothetical protein